MTTWAPARWKWRDSSRPMPRAAPVTMTVRPSKSKERLPMVAPPHDRVGLSGRTGAMPPIDSHP
jgi:hypothetical protein